MKKADRLLIMIAVCGELPAQAAVWVVGNSSYTAALITRLKKEGKIGVKNAEHLKGYVLYQKGRGYLMEKYPEFVRCHPGIGRTTIKSEFEKRQRLHRTGQAICFLFSQGVAVFGEDTSILSDSPCDGILSREKYLPSVGLKHNLAKEAGGSRACGVWLTGDRTVAYSVYNTMDSLMKWTARTEWCFHVRAQQYLAAAGRMGNQTEAGKNLQAVIMGREMSVMLKLLTSDGGMKKQLFCLDDAYESYYYLPMQPEAGLQIRLLSDRKKRIRLEKMVGKLLQVDKSGDYICAGKDAAGCPVYFVWMLEMWGIRRVADRIARLGEGKVICFDYQVQALKEYFGGSAGIMGLDNGKVRKLLEKE